MSTLVAQKQLAALIASALEQIIDQGMLNISDLPEINLEIPAIKATEILLQISLLF